MKCYRAADDGKDKLKLVDVCRAGKECLSEDQFCYCAAETPGIDGFIIIFASIDDLWRSVMSRSHVSSPFRISFFCFLLSWC